jgi:hypothetical protein
LKGNTAAGRPVAAGLSANSQLQEKGKHMNKHQLLPLAVLACTLAACGQDSTPAQPEKAAAPVASTAAAPATPAGVAPAPDAAVEHATTGRAHCNVESIAGQSLENVVPSVARDAAVPVVGWYADVEGKSAGNGLRLVIQRQGEDKQWSLAIPARTARPDVAQAQNEPSLQQTGFSFDVDLRALPAGYYGVYLTDAPVAGGACAIGRTVQLK